MARSRRRSSRSRSKERKDDKTSDLGVTIFNMFTLLQQISAMLQRSNIMSSEITDPKLRFWTTYQAIAQEFDDEFLKRYNGDMDTSMIFAGLFTAVSATFAGMMFPSLSPDPNATSQAILQVLILTQNGLTIPDNLLPVWNGPSTTTIWVQSLLYASLSCSLFVALGAVLAKQWLSHYSGVGERGMVEARGRDRHRKLVGLEIYHFRAVLETFSVLLQLSLLLFGLSISIFIFVNQIAIGIVVILANAAGAAFYFYMMTTHIVHPDSPFYSPVPTMMRNHVRLGIDRVASSLYSGAAIAAFKGALTSLQQKLLHGLAWVRGALSRIPRRFRQRELDEEAREISGIPGHDGASSAVRGGTAVVATTTVAQPDELLSLGFHWVLRTTTDPTLISHALRYAPEFWWSDAAIRQVSWELLDQIIAGVNDCVQRRPNGTCEIPDLLRTRAVAYCTGLLFFYWEKLAQDAAGYRMWIRTLERQHVEACYKRWESLAEAIGFRDFVEGKKPVGPVEGSELFFLVYLTFDHLNYLHELPYLDSLPLLRCRTASSLTSDMLQARTLVYIAQHGHYPRLSWRDMSSLTTRLAHNTQSAHSRAVHALASGIIMRYWINDWQRPDLTGLLATESLALERAVNGVVQHAEAYAQIIVHQVENRNNINFETRMLSNLIESLPGSLDQSDRDVVRDLHIPARLLALSSFLPISSATDAYLTPELLSLVSQLLKTSLAYATPSGHTATPLLASNLEWGDDLPTSHLDWLIHFLTATHHSTAASEDEVWTRSADALFVVSSLQNVGTRFAELLPALKWASTVSSSPSPEPWAKLLPADPLYKLHCATVSLLRALLTNQSIAPSPREQYALLKSTIPALPSTWCSLEVAVAGDIQDRDAAVMRIVEWMLASVPKDLGINDPANDVLVQHWINAAGRQTEVKDEWQLQRANVGRLVACDALFRSTEPWWRAPQVRRVALAVLGTVWFTRVPPADDDAYSEEFLCERTEQFVSTEFFQTETQDLLDAEWLISEMLNYMQRVSSHSESEHLHELTSQVKAKRDRLQELKAKAKLPALRDDVGSPTVMGSQEE